MIESINIVDLISTAAMHSVEVSISKSGTIRIRPMLENAAKSSTERVHRFRAKQRGNAETPETSDDAKRMKRSETHETECNVSTPPPLPLSPQTPLSPAPPPGHPSAPARERPSLEQAKAAAQEIGITPDQAEAWWHAREASQWTRSSNGSLMPVGDNWRSDAKTYCNNASQRRNETHRQTPQRSDTANAPGRYA